MDVLQSGASSFAPPKEYHAVLTCPRAERHSGAKSEESKLKRTHKPDDGSLLGLFKSEFFDIHMAVEYLYKREEQGIQDYLINSRLYAESLAHVDFYLPQLCLMALERPKNLALAKFIYDMSERHLNFALKAYWIFTGYANERRMMKEDYVWPGTVAEQIEMRMVNGNLRSLSAMASSNIDLSLIFNEKIYRAEYISLQNAFVESLTSAAIRLKGIDEKTRNAALTTFFVERNHWIEMQTRAKKIDLNSKYKKYYKGIALPLENGDDTDPTLILQIIPELGYCYNTKKRSPYKVAFETIKLFEVDQWENKVVPRPEPEEKRDGEETKGNRVPEMKRARSSVLNRSLNKVGSHMLVDLIDREAYYRAKFKGFDKFVKCIEKEEKEMEQKLRHVSSSSYSGLPRSCSPGRQKRRSHSTEKASDYMRSQMKYGVNNALAARKFSDLDIQSILQKHGKKQVGAEAGAKADEYEYIPLEKRLEGMVDPFGASWQETVDSYRQQSDYGQFDSYDIKSYIVKGNDDLRQELMAIQFMKRLQEIYTKAGIQIFLRPYEIVLTSHNSGIIEFVPDTIAVDSLKKRFPAGKAWSLNDFYRRYFYDRFEEAQKNFVESLAGYCIFNYILQVKDRHNANILIDRYGHVVHIDFGFFISNYPGGINFESAPFKLTDEYVDLMDGPNSEMFLYFKALLIKGLYELRSHAESLTTLIEVMFKGSRFSCFAGGEAGVDGLRERLHCCYSEEQCITQVENMLYYSVGNWRTAQYDNFQKFTNNIYQ